MLQVVYPKDRSLPEALALSQAVLAHVEKNGSVVLAASVVNGPAVILGAMQRAGRVVDLAACEAAGVSVLRRTTTGTAAWMGGAGLVLALALPHAASIETDATDRTLLNRNVRPFLRGFTHAGAAAHYFGREWISLRKRPVALLGFEVTRQGAVLVEVFVGFDQSIALPVDLTTVEERAVDRFQGKTPASLREVVPDARLAPFSERLIKGFVDYVAMTPTVFDVADADVKPWKRGPIPLADDLDLLPPGIVSKSLERVPIGYLEVGASLGSPESCQWLGGDVLAPRWLYEDIVSIQPVESLPAAPIEGARREDFLRVVKR